MIHMIALTVVRIIQNKIVSFKVKDTTKNWKMDPEGNIKGEYRNTLKKCGVYDMLKRKCVFLKNEGAEKG